MPYAAILYLHVVVVFFFFSLSLELIKGKKYVLVSFISPFPTAVLSNH